MEEKINLKLCCAGAIPFEEMEKVVKSICKLGYSCLVVDNGNFVFEKEGHSANGRPDDSRTPE